MPNRTRIFATAGFTVLLLALGTVDAIVTKNHIVLPTPLAADVTGNTSDSTDTAPSNDGTPIKDILQNLGLTLHDATQESLLVRIVQQPQQVQNYELFKNNDRIASIAWLETPNVKTYFQSLKDALHASFSPSVRDLRDETMTTNGPVVNILTFLDPAISEERIFFLRIRKRLIEIHVASQKDEEARGLLQALSQ